MSEIRFYHLERTALGQTLPALLSKALQNNHRIIVKTASEQDTERLNTHLWTYDPNSFLPHGSAKDTSTTDQPVFITAQDENPNNADTLILTQGTESPNLDGFNLVCDMIDGRAKNAVTAARTRWKT